MRSFLSGVKQSPNLESDCFCIMKVDEKSFRDGGKRTAQNTAKYSNVSLNVTI